MHQIRKNNLTIIYCHITFIIETKKYIYVYTLIFQKPSPSLRSETQKSLHPLSNPHRRPNLGQFAIQISRYDINYRASFFLPTSYPLPHKPSPSSHRSPRVNFSISCARNFWRIVTKPVANYRLLLDIYPPGSARDD